MADLLIVDDEKAIQESLKEILEYEGHQVTLASTGMDGILAATNKDLKAAIDAGEFREDLYHRLAVVPIHVPSLADRRSDIPLLVSHFLENMCKATGKPIPKVQSKAMSMLEAAAWTGNVRELRNVVERLLIFCPQGKAIDEALVGRYGHLS